MTQEEGTKDTEETKDTKSFDALSNRVIACALEIHSRLGPGLLEAVYERCLAYELGCAGIECRTQVEMPLRYKELNLERAYRVDLLVENRLVVEIKCADEIAPVHVAQTLSYLRLGGWSTGLVINFNVTRLKRGLKRVVL